MTHFLRLLEGKDKASALQGGCDHLRRDEADSRLFEVEPETFRQVPGAPFAYWVSERVRETFQRLPAFGQDGREVKQGLATADDFRFVRAAWEVPVAGRRQKWFGFAKGGEYSPFYSDIHLVVNWDQDGAALDAFSGSVIRNPDYYLSPGLTWPRRTTSGLGMRVMPAGCIFADKGPAAFIADHNPDELLALLAITTSAPFQMFVALQLAAADAAARSYEVGIIQRTPIPLPSDRRPLLAAKARRAWSLKRTLDTVEETSHAFLLPAALRPHLGDYDAPAIEAELARIQSEIDAVALELYGFDEAEFTTESTENTEKEETKASVNSVVNNQSSLCSWCIGVAFGRFDWRLAASEREPPPELEPFDPLPAKSPGMLPDEAEPFHRHAGILVDDPGHPHDLVRLIESVLERVDVPVPPNVRRWLRRDFFKAHLQQYSKSRRKAPIYWTLATPSGGYTLWIYYPMLTSQTLYRAVNDFIEPKLEQVQAEIAALRSASRQSGADGEKRSPNTDHRSLAIAQDFELELTELRDALLQIAKEYKPHHDDGVQISAAPLWSLFRHKPWQKVLKETWSKLEKGDYDWAHLAMHDWPARVREKCRNDRSLAIANGQEDLYEEPSEASMKQSGG